MTVLEIIFWSLLALVFYTYVGYGMVLYLLVWIKRKVSPNRHFSGKGFEPEVTLVVAAWNEKDYIVDKIENSLALDYPKDKLTLLFVTDGSDDGTPELVRNYEGVTLMHEDKRGGKTAALNRAMKHVATPIVIFTDANAMLNKEAVRNMVRHYANPKVGCVAGEKRIAKLDKDNAAGAGEGLYWKYESALKKWDFELYSAVGAAGELFSVRTDLYESVSEDTILDDFIISLRTVQKGYVIAYEPDAYASESASLNTAEEMKRKVRISAGGLQSIGRLWKLLNPLKFGILSFQFLSHRVMRWTITPVSLVAMLPVGLMLMLENGGIYTPLFVAQLLFYIAAMVGWILEKKQMRMKLLFVPFYFLMMNVSVLLGMVRQFGKKQSAVWVRSKRMSTAS